MVLPKLFKVEEIPVICKFMYNSYTRDKDDFLNYSDTVFTDLHRTNFLVKINEVEGLTGLMAYWAQMAAITRDLYTNVQLFRPQLNKLEGYVLLAKKNLTIDYKKFGITELRVDIKKKNVEGMLTKIDLVLYNVDQNNAALTAKGMKPATITTITNARKAIAGLNEQQKLKETEKELAVKANWGVIEELWDIALEVMTAGKAMYRVENKIKAKDYSQSQLKKAVDAERKKLEEPVAVEKGILLVKATNRNTGEALVDVNFEVVQTGYTDVTDEQGEGSVDLDVGVYTIRCRMDRFMPIELQNIVIKKDETTDLVVKLQALPDEV
jgi:hypothetical protein